MGSPQEAVQIVNAVIEAKKRIDRQHYPQSTTFFSKLDRWLYHEVTDGRLCQVCRFNATQQPAGGFPGDWIRINFPYLEIVDSDEIEVNAHPNCRCVMKRVIDLPED